MAATTFAEMQNELTTLRFGEQRRANVARWLQHRYRQVFGLRDWSFRQAIREPVTIGADGSFQTDVPARRIIAVELATGDALAYMTPAELRAAYPVGGPQAPPPLHYTASGGVVRVAPAPGGDLSAFCTYQRSVCCYAENGTLHAGALANATDYPIWPEEHHYLLVLGGMATGLKNVNDPSWVSVEQEFQLGVDSMIDDLMPEQYGTLQYGREDY